MKPLKLTIVNFGTYLEKQVIDFEKLDDIFLISGKTGSGKTTIFDAIVYALYGKPLGSRDEKSIASNFSEEGEQTEIVFEFKVRDNIYKIIRNFKYRKKRNGELEFQTTQGIAKKEKDEFLNISEYSKKTQLKEFVEKLLNLSFEEFSKIIILPQGEFQKFLEEDSSGKQKILRKLFPTSEHFTISEFFKKQTAQISSEMRNKEMNIQELDKSFDIVNFENDEKTVKEKIDELKKDKKSFIDINAELIKENEHQSIILKDFEQLEEKNKKYKLLKNESKNIKNLKLKVEKCEHANTLLPFIEILKEKEISYGNSKNEFLKKENECKIIEKRFIIINEKIKFREELNKNQSHLEERKGALIPLVEKEKKLNEILSSLNEYKFKFENLSGESKSLENQLSILKKKLLAQRDELVELNNGLLEKGKIQIRISELETKIKLIEQFTKYNNSLDSLKVDLKKEEKNVNYNKCELEKLNNLKQLNIASNLAISLKNGTPCLVCGSLEHPNPANKNIEIFTDEEKLEAIQNNYDNSVANKNKIEGRIQNGFKYLDEIKEELLVNKISFKENVEVYQKEYSDLSNSLKIIEKKVLRINLVQNEILKNEKQELQMQSKNEEFKISISELEKKIISCKTEIVSINKDLNNEVNIREKLDLILYEIKSNIEEIKNITKEEREIDELSVRNKSEFQNWKRRKEDDLLFFNQAKSKLEKEIEIKKFNSIEDVNNFLTTEKELKKLKNEITNFNETFIKTETEIIELENRLKNKEKPQIDKLEKLIKENNLSLDLCEKELLNNNKILNELIRNFELYRKYEKDLKKMQEDSKTIFELNNDLNGSNYKKVNFQNFILNFYLNRVSRYANLRLNKFSDGRYEIVVNNNAKNQISQAGLDLDVLDTFTGIPRSVKTLSGGEKFMASLSLALGLSDAIQERAGMIEMDSLFLDEGFGTLDDEALNRAISILDDIRENRMIGVISHVAELKNRIPCQIKVIKTSNGSKIQMP